MKYFLFIIVVFIPSLGIANTYSAIDYTITPIFTGDIPYIKVYVEIKGKLSDEVVIDLPSRWGPAEYYDQVKNFKLNYPQGKIQFKKAGKDGRQNTAVITISKTDRLSFNYEVYQKTENPLDVHETIIRKDLIHTLGHGIFAFPNDAQDIEKIKLSVKWNNIPGNWRTLSAYGNERKIEYVGNVMSLVHSFYVAGDVRIFPIGGADDHIYLSLYGEFSFEDESIISDIGKIIESQRSFFNDHDFPYYTISMIEGDDPYTSGGTGLHNSFAVHLPGERSRLDWYILCAHEHFHNWMGGKIQRDGEEASTYWWNEGFTDYYSRVLALRSGGISIEEFIDECNQLLRNYYLSPVLNEPNARIESDFWQNFDMGRLPYYRGFVFAIYLNYLIKKHNPDNSLDNVMFDLLKNAQQKKFSPEYFCDILKSYVPQGIKEDMSRFIDQGETIELDDVAMFLPTEKITMGSYELGFDRDFFIKNEVIQKINETSNAYRAGLRDGDKIIEFSVPKGRDHDQLAKFVTTEKSFMFRPENLNEKRFVYQFKKDLSQGGKDKIRKFFGS